MTQGFEPYTGAPPPEFATSDATSGAGDEAFATEKDIGIKNAKGSFRSGKIYTHSVGLSCCFRQHRATSHCNLLHGYALQVEVEFGADVLDERNWVQDFGGLKPLKSALEATFDHKTLVAKDDPQISIFREMHIAKLIDLVIVESVGIESFAYQIFGITERGLANSANSRQPNDQAGRVWVEKVTVREHEGNYASYSRPTPNQNVTLDFSMHIPNEQDMRKLMNLVDQRIDATLAASARRMNIR